MSDKRKILFLFCLLVINFSFAQNTFRCIVADSATNELITGANAVIKNTNKGATSDLKGRIEIKNIPDGEQQILFSFIGYSVKTLKIVFPQNPSDSITYVYLTSVSKELEGVNVVSFRTNSRIEDLPTKIEVLGNDDLNEENGIKPGNIASLLGDIAGIQLQQTSPVTGNADIRIQGLQGKYTQYLRDGMPIFGGYSESFSILQIPPLDLKQIEIIKGASSTLYGGGAIAGLINIISKEPQKGVFEKSITLNQSSLFESNANAYISNLKKNFGYNCFLGGTYQRATDINGDGFTDIPEINNVFIHPRFFFYLPKNTKLIIGISSDYEDRKGGDVKVLKGEKDSLHQFYIFNESFRNTFDVVYERSINANETFSAKGTISVFNQNMETDLFAMNAQQISYYTEVSYLKKKNANSFVLGCNLNGEMFDKINNHDLKIPNFTESTTGVFVQSDWKVFKPVNIQSGIRADINSNEGTFVLPRVFMLFKLSKYTSARIGGGMGYKTPSYFNQGTGERDYSNILPMRNSLKSESSMGFNCDLNYQKLLFDELSLTFNPAVFYTKINEPIIFSRDTNNFIEFYNASKSLVTQGVETYVRIKYKKFEAYIGHVYTDARKEYDTINTNMVLIARNKFSTVMSYEFSDNLLAGIETSYIGQQYIDEYSRSPEYMFIAAMIKYVFKKFTFVLNCENALDYRQTKHENIVIAPYNNPSFKEIWAPVDGRVINFSVNIKL